MTDRSFYLRIGTDDPIPLTASDLESAKRAATEMVDACVRDWHEPLEPDEPTYWLDIEILDSSGVVGGWLHPIHPPEPPCDDPQGHHWAERSDVRGHGGGVILRTRCERCGVVWVEDTWATHPATGEQGLRATWYEVPDAFTVPDDAGIACD